MKLFLIVLILLSVITPKQVLAESPPDNASSKKIKITASVPVKATNYIVSLERITPGNNFPQNSLISYKITYGSSVGFATNFTLEASYTDGVIEGGENPSVEVVNYAIGSATAGYNNSPAIIDPINKKIYWNNNLPANLKNQTVFFSLKTNANYQGSKRVLFNVSSKIATPEFSSGEKIVSQYYLYDPKAQAYSSSSPFLDVYIRSVSETEAKITVILKGSYIATVKYGLSPNTLDQKTVSISKDAVQDILLSNLKPQTQYYFTVDITDQTGKTVQTETFTFTTAFISDKPEVKKDSLIITSLNTFLTTPDSQKQAILIPEKTPYEVRFRVKNPELIKNVQIFIRNKSILGISTNESTNFNTEISDVAEVEPGIFVGRLKTPLEAGLYEILVKITDRDGHLMENKLIDLKVSNNIRVLSNDNNQPIESARVLLSVYNPKSKLYEVIPEQILFVKNPSFSQPDGEINLTLPEGKYKVKVLSLGYKKQEVDFEIGPFDYQGYPIITLDKEPLNMITTFQYYWEIFSDTLVFSKIYIQNLSESIRFFELNALLATVFLIFLSLLSLTSRLHIPLRSLPEYLTHLARIHALQKKLAQGIKGRVFDEGSGQGLAGAQVYLIDVSKNKIVSSTKTNTAGDFSFLKLSTQSYQIEVMKDGFEPIIFHESEIHSVGLGGYLLNIKKRDFGLSVRENTWLYLTKITGLAFESLLIISLIFEVALGVSLGWIKTLPFLLCSLASLVLWIIHLGHLRSEKNIF